MPRWHASALVLSLAASGSALATPVPTKAVAAPRPAVLLIEPPELVLDRPRSPRQVLVTGRYADGCLEDLTDRASFHLEGATVATVGPHGEVTSVHDGRAVVVATAGGRTARIPVRVIHASAPARPTFATHVAPLLTSAGCNSGNCHGGPIGKGGLRLSLFGSAPEQDYRALALDGRGRRVNRTHPEASLILRKPTLSLPHQGGRRFTPDSREYRALAEWIAAGAPVGTGRPEVTDLEVLPRGRILSRAGQKQRLVVLARYSDGTTEDVTAQAVLQSNDEGIIQVEPGALATAVGEGEAALMVRYAGRIAAARLGATTRPEIRDFPTVPTDNPVDRFVFGRLKALHLRPSGLCSDEEFLRRAFLDLTGTLPTPEETRAFLSECAAEREVGSGQWAVGSKKGPGGSPAHPHTRTPTQSARERLVDSLLQRPEYADLQALLWADRLRSNSRFHRVGGVRCYQKWLKESFQANIPLDQFARKLLTALGQNFSDGPANYWGNYDVISRPDEIAPQTSQLFLGVRLHCAQCHNHPFERWKQDDFYSLAAVFARVKGKGTKQPQEFELYLDPKETVANPDTGQVMPARALDSPVFRAGPDEDLRVRFADWLTAPENPYFARAMVNRLWKQMMGRGLVEPVDDFRATNPPTHPELLDALARELVTHGFEQKRVLRVIATSRAYQLSCQPNATNAGDTRYYSRAYPRRMPAEIYFDAICQVTEQPEEFKAWPEAKRAAQLPENRYPSYFLDTFGRGNRLVICDREAEGTMSQALNLINGTELQGKVASKTGTLAKLLAREASDDAVLDELFLATLCRFPRDAERRRLARQRAAAPSREEGFQDVLWALLSSREFMFNH